MEKRGFYAPDVDPFALGQALTEWFTGQGYQTQAVPSQNGSITVQAKKEDTLRSITGMSTALTAVVTLDGENISVEMGNARWMDKAIAGGVGVLLFAPALITAGIGVYQQSQLQNNAWKFISDYIRSNSAFGGSVVGGNPNGVSASNKPVPDGGFPGPIGVQQTGQTPPPPLNLSGNTNPGLSNHSNTQVCSSCQQALRPGAKFCDNCGAPAPVTRACKSCGRSLRPGARFCDECGSPA